MAAKRKVSLFYRIRWRLTEIAKRIFEFFFPNMFYFSHRGYCPCCEKKTLFVSYDNWLRDHFSCRNCRSGPRDRALMHFIARHYPNWKELTIHESSPRKGSTSDNLERQCVAYTPSHFYPEHTFGTIVNGFRNENLEELTFEDESFDIVVTGDVMEHVYNPDKVFKEVYRTLKPGGAYIFTTPLVNKHKKTEKWAILGEDGEPVFLVSPEWHGNPIKSEGSPVTMHWGYDIVEYIEDCVGQRGIIEYVDDISLGIRAEYNEVVICKKPGKG